MHEPQNPMKSNLPAMKFDQSLQNPDQEFLSIPDGFLCSTGIVGCLWTDSDDFFEKDQNRFTKSSIILDFALSATPPTESIYELGPKIITNLRLKGIFAFGCFWP